MARLGQSSVRHGPKDKLLKEFKRPEAGSAFSWGRDTTYTPERCDELIRLMGQGRSFDGCSMEMGVHIRTMYNWIKDHPEFLQAVEQGKVASATYWENNLIRISEGGSGNANAIIMGLRNRARHASGWHHDVQRVEHTGADGGAIQVDNVAKVNVELLDVEQREQLRLLLTHATEKEGESDE